MLDERRNPKPTKPDRPSTEQYRRDVNADRRADSELVDVSIFARGAKSRREQQLLTIDGEIVGAASDTVADRGVDETTGSVNRVQENDDTIASTPAKTPVGLISPFRGNASIHRVQAVRQALETALDEWWSYGEYLSQELLRDSLLVLEAGHDLDEPHRSLVLRTSLQLRRGMVTALRHQTDADRTAYIIKEALLDEAKPLPLSTLWRLKQEDEESAEWSALLLDDLQQDALVLSGPKGQLAQNAIQQLLSGQPLALEKKPKRRVFPSTTRPPFWSMGRFLLILLSCAALLGLYIWQQQKSDFSQMVLVPAGSYAIGNDVGDAIENHRTVAAFAIDRTEVTNHTYQICLDQGGCRMPIRIGSQMRPDYFVDPAFADYPVVNVDWARAHEYCAWAGKRLPTADEWEIAAAIAPATGRRYIYPWGNQFHAQFANSAVAARADTTPVGSYYPAGTSSFGAVDMAGNVAEWTATEMGFVHEGADSEVKTYAIKGGSFVDPPDLLRTNIRQSYALTTAEPWLGFRCAATEPIQQIATR